MLELRLELDQESAQNHGASDEEEEAMRKILASLGLVISEDGDIVEDKISIAQDTIICSCGFFTCPYVGTYGHPLPVFKEDIEPLFPQIMRDIKALELKNEPVPAGMKDYLDNLS